MPGKFSRQTVQLMLELSGLLRSHGIHISLTERDVDQQLITASEIFDDKDIQTLRQRLIEMQSPGSSPPPSDSGSGTSERSLPTLSSPTGMPTRLQGGYLDNSQDTRERGIVVEYISLEGLQFRTHAEHTIAPGDRICVQFTLDDKNQTLLWQEVQAREVQGHTIQADFVGEGNAGIALDAFLQQMQNRADDPFELQLE